MVGRVAPASMTPYKKSVFSPRLYTKQKQLPKCSLIKLASIREGCIFLMMQIPTLKEKFLSKKTHLVFL
jgi:hypothetical protein